MFDDHVLRFFVVQAQVLDVLSTIFPVGDSIRLGSGLTMEIRS